MSTIRYRLLAYPELVVPARSPCTRGGDAEDDCLADHDVAARSPDRKEAIAYTACFGQGKRTRIHDIPYGHSSWLCAGLSQ